MVMDRAVSDIINEMAIDIESRFISGFNYRIISTDPTWEEVKIRMGDEYTFWIGGVRDKLAISITRLFGDDENIEGEICLRVILKLDKSDLDSRFGDKWVNPLTNRVAGIFGNEFSFGYMKRAVLGLGFNSVQDIVANGDIN